MRPLAPVALAALIFAVACTRKSPDEQLVKSIDAAAAWVPTLQMTAEKWTGNSVPSTFAGSASHAAQKEFDKAQKEIAKSKASPALRKRIAADLRLADDFAEKLESAVDHDDPRLIVPAIRSLPPIKNDLDSIQKQYGSGS